MTPVLTGSILHVREVRESSGLSLQPSPASLPLHPGIARQPRAAQFSCLCSSTIIFTGSQASSQARGNLKTRFVRVSCRALLTLVALLSLHLRDTHTTGHRAGPPQWSAEGLRCNEKRHALCPSVCCAGHLLAGLLEKSRASTVPATASTAPGLPRMVASIVRQQAASCPFLSCYSGFLGLL